MPRKMRATFVQIATEANLASVGARRSETFVIKDRCKKAVGSRASGALLRCGKPARHAIRNDRGKALSWLCREHHRAWTRQIGRLLADENPQCRRITAKNC